MSKTPETLTTEESESLLKEIEFAEKPYWSRWHRQRDTVMFLLMLDAGLRVGEVSRLLVSDLIISGQPVLSLDVVQRIAEKGCVRLVPVSSRLLASLQKMNDLVWMPDYDQTPFFAFFSNDTQRHLTVRQIQRIIASASLKAFGRPIHPHVLRHTFATRLMRITNVRVVQQLLGHKRLTSTQVYTHPNSDDCKKAIDSL